MKRKYDAIIVGAGPGGCSAAICLASKGYDVLLVDKAKFPRDKVCGDGIGPPALEVLDRLGVTGKILGANPWRIDGVEISSPAGQMVRASFRHLEGLYKHGWVMPREKFDFLLLQRVESFSNVQVLENREVKDLSYAGSRIEGVKVKCGAFLEEFTGKVIIGADGVHSRIAQKISFPGGISQSYAFAVRAYFDHVEGLNHYIEIHCEKSIFPAYGWIFPTDEGSANIGVGISSRFLKKRDLKNLFNSFTRGNGFLREKLHKAQLIKNSFKGWPIPLGTFFPRRSHKNVLLLGDAGCFADSLTGEGIYYALRSGECAAEAFHTGLNTPGGIPRMGEVYEKLWRKAFKSREYLIGKIFQRFVLTEFFCNYNVRRALQKPIMGQTLASILCHQKTKIRLLF